MIVRGHAGFGALDNSAVDDPVIAALRPRVTVTEDPAMTAAVPRLRPARVTVTLTDGRRATQACESHRGDYQAPFSDAEVRGKFAELAGVVLTAREWRRSSRPSIDARNGTTRACWRHCVGVTSVRNRAKT